MDRKSRTLEEQVAYGKGFNDAIAMLKERHVRTGDVSLWYLQTVQSEAERRYTDALCASNEYHR